MFQVNFTKVFVSGLKAGLSVPVSVKVSSGSAKEFEARFHNGSVHTDSFGCRDQYTVQNITIFKV